MKTIVLISILFIIGCSPNERNFVSFIPKDEAKVFTAYKWHYFLIEPDTVFYGSNTKFTGNGKLESNRNLIRILAFDTTKCTIELFSKHDNTLIGKKELSAIPNKYFNEDWKKLKPGETPTPLTAKQAYALSNFMKYKSLNKSAPNFVGITSIGDSITESILMGKITLANFWYYGCVPCMAEIPTLNRISNSYSSDTTIQFLSFFMDSIFVDSNGLLYQSGDFSTDTNLMKPQEIDLEFTLIPNSKSIKKEFNVLSFPTNMIIDQEGIIREIIVGANPDKDSKVLESNIINAIEKLKTTANNSE